MSSPSNYGPLVDLVNRNTATIREAYNEQKAKAEELEKMIVAQNAKVATLTAQVAALQKQVILAAVNRGSGATVV